MSKAKILVVDDEPDILSLIVYQLSREGYGVSTASSGRSALDSTRSDPPDLVVLDVMLPGIDGFETLRALRAEDATAEIPVILLTALGDEQQRVRGFELGADDYVTKPFSAKELVLRVGALLRRSQAEPITSENRITAGSIQINRDAHTASVDGRELDLTLIEFRLLETLVERRGRVQSRRQLLAAAWDTNAAIETRTVDMHVARIRSKLGEAGKLIETVRGVGYRLRIPGQHE
ncbi:MAG: response regulator transcription factor [Gemmatimonadota bacterium]